MVMMLSRSVDWVVGSCMGECYTGFKVAKKVEDQSGPDLWVDSGFDQFGGSFLISGLTFWQTLNLII